MPRIKETTIYTFEELPESAKETARENYRAAGLYDEWYDYIFEDSAQCAEILGLDIRQRQARTMGGATVYNPSIYFSGFSHQGNGACFEGTYRYKPGALKAIKAHAPQDQALHAIARDLQAIQARNFYRLNATCSQRGRYMSLSVDVSNSEGFDVSRDAGDSITQSLRDFADWIYSQLEKEYDYLNSDSAVDESIIANGYEFTICGNIT